MSRLVDLIGQHFDRLTVIKRSCNSKNGHACWLCQCSCGQKRIVSSDSLKSERTKSCGCLSAEKTKRRFTKHGHTRSRTYESWQHMNQRCKNPNNQDYHNYGGRGIIICKRWEKFENFLEDMGERPAGTSLDKINNNHGYCETNCRWSTPEQQNKNKRNNLYETYGGKTQLVTKWAKEYDISYHILWDRLYRLDWSISKALTTPVRIINRGFDNRKTEDFVLDEELVSVGQCKTKLH